MYGNFYELHKKIGGLIYGALKFLKKKQKAVVDWVDGRTADPPLALWCNFVDLPYLESLTFKLNKCHVLRCIILYLRPC